MVAVTVLPIESEMIDTVINRMTEFVIASGTSRSTSREKLSIHFFPKTFASIYGGLQLRVRDGKRYGTGSAERPEHRSKGLLIDAQVAPRSPYRTGDHATFPFFITFEGERSAVPALAGLGWIPNTAGRKPVL